MPKKITSLCVFHKEKKDTYSKKELSLYIQGREGCRFETHFLLGKRMMKKGNTSISMCPKLLDSSKIDVWHPLANEKNARLG